MKYFFSIGQEHTYSLLVKMQWLFKERCKSGLCNSYFVRPLFVNTRIHVKPNLLCCVFSVLFGGFMPPFSYVIIAWYLLSSIIKLEKRSGLVDRASDLLLVDACQVWVWNQTKHPNVLPSLLSTGWFQE